MLVEGTGGIGALRRSFKLVETRWWATAGRMGMTYILVLVVTTVATLLFIAPTGSFIDDTSFGALILEHAANLVVSLVTTPFVAAVTTLVYFDLRVRKEGFDLALLAERMGGPAASGPSAAVSAIGRATAVVVRARGWSGSLGRPVAPPGASAPYAPPVAPAPPAAPAAARGRARNVGAPGGARAAAAAVAGRVTDAALRELAARAAGGDGAARRALAGEARAQAREILAQTASRKAIIMRPCCTGCSSRSATGWSP